MEADDEVSPSRLSVQQKIQIYETPQRESATFREKNEPASARRRLIGALHVCGQSSPIDEDRQPIPVHYVAIEDILGEVMLLSLPLSLSQSLSLSLLSFVVAVVMV